MSIHLQTALSNAKRHPRFELAVPLNKFKTCRVGGAMIAYTEMDHGLVPLGILCNRKKLKTEYRVTVHPFESLDLEKAADNICMPKLARPQAAIRVGKRRKAGKKTRTKKERKAKTGKRR